jgi:hypothetical protein
MIEKIKAVGKTYVATEGGQHLSTIQGLGKMKLPNGEFVQVKRVTATASSGATTDILAAVADKCFRVLSGIILHGGTAGTIKFVSHDGSGTDISPTFSNAANGGMVLPHNPHGWFQCLSINAKLQATVSSSSDVSVQLTFVEIPDDCMDLL